MRVENRAARALRDLSGHDRARVLATLERLEQDPRPRGVRKLAGAGGWRVRVGPWRILYTIDDGERQVTVYVIGHRREAYRSR